MTLERKYRLCYLQNKWWWEHKSKEAMKYAIECTPFDLDGLQFVASSLLKND
jgi:hypothetical protein